MNVPLHLDEYLRYIHSNPGKTADHQFKCGGRRGERPRLHNLLPGGDCFIYPEFLVFLTGAKNETGWRTGLQNAIDFVAADLALARWANNPTTILKDIAKSINSYLNPEQLDKLLSNPHSVFVPLRTLQQVEAARDWTQGNYIILHTDDGVVVLAEHLSEYPNAISDVLNGRKPRFVTPGFLYRKMKGYITGEWQSEAVEALKVVARR
jgi:hypothetical protein